MANNAQLARKGTQKNKSHEQPSLGLMKIRHIAIHGGKTVSGRGIYFSQAKKKPH